jgi:hypothetical protein
MSGLLSQLYYLISGDKPINTSNLSNGFRTQVGLLAKMIQLTRANYSPSHKRLRLAKGERQPLY